MRFYSRSKPCSFDLPRLPKGRLKTCFVSTGIFIIITGISLILPDFAAGRGKVGAGDIAVIPVRQVSQESGRAQLIHFGDLVEVDVVGSTEFDWRGRVSPEGFLEAFRFSEKGIYALCRSPREVAETVAREYARFLKDPTVKVSILDRSGRQEAVIYGAVRTEQRFRLSRPVRIQRLIILSGGLTGSADGRIRILRSSLASCLTLPLPSNEDAPKEAATISVAGGQRSGTWAIDITVKELLSGRKGANLLVFYGDVITVMESKPVYVIGGVRTPSRIDYREGLSVSRAISSAGGLSRKADPGRITVYRRENGASRIIKVDLSKRKDKADVMLRPYDIVEVGRKGRRAPKYPPVLESDVRRRDPGALPVRRVN